jgi:hypothetical protein
MNRSLDTHETTSIEFSGYAGGGMGKPDMYLHTMMLNDFFGCILDEKYESEAVSYLLRLAL